MSSIADSYVVMNTWVVSLLGDAHTLAHVHAGLAIYIGVQFVTRDRRASAHGLICVLMAELGNEMLEAIHYDSMRWADTIGDIAMTLFWPVLLYSVARYRRRRWERAALTHARLQKMVAA